MLASGRHHYANMPPLLSRRAPAGAACPFRCPAHPTARRYHPGMLPRTDDLLGRSIALSAGVTDSYLGSSFGITVRSTPEEIAGAAARFRAAVTARRAVPARG